MAVKLFLPLVFFAFILTACEGTRRVRPDLHVPEYSVALLPIYNATNDVDGPRSVREEFFKKVQFRRFAVKPIKETDQILMDRMGITLGSQLEMTTAKALGETLGVDAVLYGYLLNFDDITTGVYNVKKVRAAFKLVDVRTGHVVWARALGVKTALAGGDIGAGVMILKEAGGDGVEGLKSIQGIEDIPGLDDWHFLAVAKTEKVGNAAMIAIGEKLLTKALGIYLRAETDVMLDRILVSMPAASFWIHDEKEPPGDEERAAPLPPARPY